MKNISKFLVFIISCTSVILACGENPEKEYVIPDKTDKFYEQHAGEYKAISGEESLSLFADEFGNWMLKFTNVGRAELDIRLLSNRLYLNLSGHNVDEHLIPLTKEQVEEVRAIKDKKVYIDCTFSNEEEIWYTFSPKDGENLPKNTKLVAHQSRALYGAKNSDFILYSTTNSFYRPAGYSYWYDGWGANGKIEVELSFSISGIDLKKQLRESDMAKSICRADGPIATKTSSFGRYLNYNNQYDQSSDRYLMVRFDENKSLIMEPTMDSNYSNSSTKPIVLKKIEN